MINHDEYIKRRDLALNRYFAHRAAGIKTAHEEAQQAIDALVLEREQALLDEILMVARNQPNGTKEDLLVFIKSKRSIVKGGE